MYLALAGACKKSIGEMEKNATKSCDKSWENPLAVAKARARGHGETESAAPLWFPVLLQGLRNVGYAGPVIVSQVGQIFLEVGNGVPAMDGFWQLLMAKRAF